MVTKTAIVTGGTKGIGKGICKLLLSKGYTVFTNYSTDDLAAQSMIQDNKKYGNRLTIIKASQSNYTSFLTFIERIKQKTDHIDCIVCNSGATVRKPVQEIDNGEWEYVMNVTLNSHFYLIRDLFDRINPNSRILFIGSLMGIHPHATSVAYGVSKAALHALAKNLVKDFAHTGTTVNVIAPGFVETDWQTNKPEEIRQNIYSKTANGRFATIQEITSALDLCLNNEFINGSILEISGGYSYK